MLSAVSANAKAQMVADPGHVHYQTHPGAMAAWQLGVASSTSQGRSSPSPVCLQGAPAEPRLLTVEERGVLLHNFTADGDTVSVFERHRLTPRDPGSARVPDRHRRQELKRHVARQTAGMCLQVMPAVTSCLHQCLHVRVQAQLAVKWRAMLQQPGLLRAENLYTLTGPHARLACCRAA